jgi:hypothetical protein
MVGFWLIRGLGLAACLLAVAIAVPGERRAGRVDPGPGMQAAGPGPADLAHLAPAAASPGPETVAAGTTPTTMPEGLQPGAAPQPVHVPVQVAPLVKIRTLAPLVEKYARQYGVDEDLVWAVMRQESGFNPRALSPKGAMGLMQLMPGTAALMGVADAYDVEENIAGGVRYLEQCLNRFDQDVGLGLAAYNAGPGNVEKYQGCPPFPETRQYVASILAAYAGEAAWAEGLRPGASPVMELGLADPPVRRGLAWRIPLPQWRIPGPRPRLAPPHWKVALRPF